MRLAPILHLAEHAVDGGCRWTGRAVLPGVICRDVVVLRVRQGLLAVRDRCPHRGVSMLLGRLDETAGTLECPSHGWRLPLFGGELCGAPVVEREGKLFLVLEAAPPSMPETAIEADLACPDPAKD